MDQQTLQTIQSLSTNLRLGDIKKRTAKKWSLIAAELYQVKTSIESLEKLEKQLIEELKILSKGETSHDGIFCYTLTIRKGSIDYAKVKELEGINLEPYRKSGVEAWKLTKI